ncbi:MAG: ribbon-helix-helix protein, CopG family [Magnetococcales bacterium]|nr:ribbon-helix-helix protein, CopG family [Magnetococcales bacterium]
MMLALLLAAQTCDTVRTLFNNWKGVVMSKSVTLTACVDPNLDAELSRLAAAAGRTKSWLINEAMRFYVAHEVQFLAAVEEGKQAMRENRVVDHQTVVLAFERVIAPRP